MIWLFLFLILICIIDLELKIIPNLYTIIGSIMGFIYSSDIKWSLLGLIVGILSVWMINNLKIQRLGGGDAKLMGMIGVYLGPLVIIPILALAYITFLPYRYYSYKSSIAYSPFIIIGVVGVVLWNAILF